MKVVTAWKAKFSHCDFKQVPKSKNNPADSLATLASAVDFQFRHEISAQHILNPSIHKLDEESFIETLLQDGGIPLYPTSKMECSPRTRLKHRSCNTLPPDTHSLESSYKKNNTLGNTTIPI